MINEIAWLVVYLSGFFMSRGMLRIEHEAEEHPFTRADIFLTNAFALFSYLTVLIIVFRCWYQKIAASGYWNKPANPEKQDKK